MVWRSGLVLRLLDQSSIFICGLVTACLYIQSFTHLEGRVFTPVVEIVLIGDLSVLIHLFNQYGLMGIYFILWVIIPYCFISFIAHIIVVLATGSSFR